MAPPHPRTDLPTYLCAIFFDVLPPENGFHASLGLVQQRCGQSLKGVAVVIGNTINTTKQTTHAEAIEMHETKRNSKEEEKKQT